MGLSPAAVAANLAFFERHDGYCDCEVWMNVERSVVRSDLNRDDSEERPDEAFTEDGAVWGDEW